MGRGLIIQAHLQSDNICVKLLLLVRHRNHKILKQMKQEEERNLSLTKIVKHFVIKVKLLDRWRSVATSTSVQRETNLA
jgi:hypothetical protein